MADVKNRRIRVFLADDHPALRMGLRVLLEQTEEIEVVGEAEDGKKALALIETLLPDVAVLDCHLPEKTGSEVAAEIRNSGLPTRVLALSAYKDERYVLEMLAAGAVGYLVKEEAPAAIAAAVQAAARGEGWFSPSVSPWAAAWARGERPRHTDLTDREMTVLKLVAKGMSNKEIARELKVADRTVEFHMTNILGKLAVTSRLEAAMWVKDRRLD